jgi:hypothetical protein
METVVDYIMHEDHRYLAALWHVPLDLDPVNTLSHVYQYASFHPKWRGLEIGYFYVVVVHRTRALDVLAAYDMLLREAKEQLRILLTYNDRREQLEALAKRLPAYTAL